ncbi:MAG: hypothetical protein R6W68_11410 [Ignavibacteriaceae bacterium]
MRDLKSRIVNLENKFGSNEFFERMEKIFATGSYDKLTEKDVIKLKELMPDKFKILSDEIFKLTYKNI